MNQELTQYAQQSMSKGSKSFAMAAMFFDLKTRQDVWLLYSWCRFVDDIADGDLSLVEKKKIFETIQKSLNQIQFGQKDFSQNDYSSINVLSTDDQQEKILNHPAQRAFLLLVNKYQIKTQYAVDLIRGMMWDLDFRPIKDQADLEDYCYCVAGTVGLMMCSVMGVHHPEAFPFAKAMGNAMQLTNICRDLVEDRQRRRCYLPVSLVREKLSLNLNIEQTYQWMLTEMNHEQLYTIAKIELERADELYTEGLQGIIYLPFRAAWAVLSAKYIYRQIGVKITQLGVAAISERVYTTKAEKIILIFRALADLLVQIPQRLKRNLV